MRALILAAGVGKRIAGAHPAPKCLLRFGGRTLLERHLELLRACGVDEVVICVGYRENDVRAELARLGAGGVTVVPNAEFTLGSVISLWAVRDWLDPHSGALVMDADVLYDRRMLGRLTGTSVENCFLLDRDFEPGDEPVKLCVAGGRLVEFRKRIAPDLPYEYSGESVGFFRFGGPMARRLASRCEHYRAAGRGSEPHEEAIRDLLLESPDEFGFEDVTGLPWLEIDFEEDIGRAERTVLPLLHD